MSCKSFQANKLVVTYNIITFYVMTLYVRDSHKSIINVIDSHKCISVKKIQIFCDFHSSDIFTGNWLLACPILSNIRQPSMNGSIGNLVILLKLSIKKHVMKTTQPAGIAVLLYFLSLCDIVPASVSI